MKKLLVSLAPFSGLFLLVASLCNFYLAYRCSFVVSSTCVTNYVNVASSSVDSLTNIASSISSPSSAAPSRFFDLSSITSKVSVSSSPPPPPEKRQLAEYPYQYFVVGRRIGALLFGRYYYDGSPCSMGRIRSIYPDRIILDTGDWIQNQNLFSTRERFVKNDR